MMPDYRLYLVTDSTPEILRGKDLPSLVAAAIVGGVTIVQYRDKHSDTAELIRVAKALHKITRSHGVPLLINDRIDVALAVGAEGVHLGQNDTDVTTARRLLGKDAIIGVTISSKAEAYDVVQAGHADYVGIGTMFATSTKVDTKAIIGIQGTREILDELARTSPKLATVSIGGLNAQNVPRVLYQSRGNSKGLDGVAVVSAIISARDAEAAARKLRNLIDTPFAPLARFGASAPGDASKPSKKGSDSVASLLGVIPSVIRGLGQQSPLCHNMTNLVVQNFAANVILAIGGSPIMAGYGIEAQDLALHGGSLVVNMGTVTPEGLENYQVALRAYNELGGPTLFDPVGAGATSARRGAVKTLMAGGYFNVIKGNESEIKTVAGDLSQQKGVDSSASTLTTAEKVDLVRDLARHEKCVVLMTGKVDYVSDGDRTFAIANGHEYLGKITGSGCALGSTVAACLGSAKKDNDMLATVIAGMLLYEIAAEHAARRVDVQGPGTFIPAFIDELYRLSQRTLAGDDEWLKAAKVTLLCPSTTS